jgi:hypothetical protein
MRSRSSMRRKRSSPSIVSAAPSASARAATLPGRTGPPPADNARTWCCWHMSDRPSPGRTAPMAPST